MPPKYESEPTQCCVTPGAKRLNRRNAERLFDNAHTFLVSVEGVLIEDGVLIEGSLETILDIISTGKRVFYIENTNVKTRRELIEELEQWDFPCSEYNVISSAVVAAEHLKQRRFEDKVYIMGESEVLGAELNVAGIRYVKTGDLIDGYDIQSCLESTFDRRVRCVLVGHDDKFDFTKLVEASTYLKNPWCMFMSTTDIPKIPRLGSKLVYPDVGALTAAISHITERKPFVVGMPSYTMFKWLSRNREITIPKTVVIGAELNTDIAFAQNIGMKSLIVLSGGTRLKNFKPPAKAKPVAQPDYYCTFLEDFGNYLF